MFMQLRSGLLCVFTARIIINIRVAGRKSWDSDGTLDLHMSQLDGALSDAGLPSVAPARYD